MLTPEYLNLIEFNDVVELYNKLNIEITADIIKRISRNQEIIPSSRKQLEILIQTNGIEIFNETLEKTSMLNADTKKQLKELFSDMIKEDMQGYEELYQYRNKPFKLSETQYKILNEGLKQTNRTLKNLTNTIAFQSKQTYVNAVDMAYMKTVTGGFSYNQAIKEAVQELANKGITLKDKRGRNVQLEVAVRRNVLSGIKDTANRINRDIEEYLGCDGYEVTAHTGARPSHAEEQGKQFAIKKEDASKYGVGLWSDVEHLWEEYNCRHSYFGIILGISDPQYTDKELKEMKEATVELNGEKVPYYEATQKQRALENNIRKTKRSIQTLEKAKEDSTVQKSQLTQLNKQLNKLLDETGLKKDYARTQIANEKNNKTKLEPKEYKKQYKVTKQQYYEDENGKRYKVDGKNVKMEPSQSEIQVAELLGKLYNTDVNIIPKVSIPSGTKTPDYIINNERFDLKEIEGNSKNTLDDAIKKQQKQAHSFVLDISKSEMSEEKAIEQIQRIFDSKHRNWVERIILTKNNGILQIFERK